VKAGFALFPIKWSNKQQKYIPVKRWNETTYDPDLEPSMLGDLFGVVLQHDDLVIDVDPRRYPPGENMLIKFWDDHHLPRPIDTFIVDTPSGGSHIYLKKPAGVDVVRYLEKTYPGIEIKSKGQFVYGCGSVKTKGEKTGAYIATRGHVGAILEAPESLIDGLQKPVTLLTGAAKETDEPAIIRRYEHYLRNAEPAIENKGGNNQTYRVACVGKDFGLSESAVIDLMLEIYNPRCSPAWGTEELAEIVRHAFEYSKSSQGCRSSVEEDFADDADLQEHVKTASPKLPRIKFQTRADASNAKKNQLEPTIANALYLFLLEQWRDNPNPLYKLIRYNLFSEQIEFTRRAPWHVVDQKHWQDDDDILLRFYFSDQMFFEAPTYLCREVAVAVSRQYQYHPIIDDLKAIKWDGVSRIDKLFTYYAGAVDTAYHRAVGRIVMIGAIARIMEPGCKFDVLPILEGEQGTGKSTFIKILGGKYYKEITLDMHKLHDTVAKMMSGWIIETPEMTFLKRSEADELKFFLSTGVDTVRFAYGRHTRDIPRRSIFLGTYNRETGVGYLKDTTGNRRFLPIATGGIKLEELERDRDQLFAEALYRYNQGEPWYFDDTTLIEAARVEQKNREVAEPWTMLIQDALADKDVKEIFPDLTILVIATQILGITTSRVSPYDLKRIANAMRELGYESRVKTIGGKSTRVYVEKSSTKYKYAGDI